MKRFALSALFLLATILSTHATGFVDDGWVSLQFNGRHQVSIGSVSGTTDVNTGLAIGAEFGEVLASWAELGIGTQAEFYRSQTVYPGNFGFDDFFVFLRFPVEAGPIAFYPVGRVGYGLFTGDVSYTGTYGTLSGGLYYSAGIGLRGPVFQDPLFKNAQDFLFVEGTYDSNSGSVYDPSIGVQASVVYAAVNLYVGFGGEL